MNKTSIGWCTHTWNPITGCRRQCVYCYARRQHARFSKRPFSEIVLHPARLEDADLEQSKSRTVFVGSMSDIQYWPREWTAEVIKIAAAHQQHTFMFLSKGIDSYSGFQWPANTMQGLTVERLDVEMIRRDVVHFVRTAPRPFLSIEPILGPVLYDFAEVGLVIVGAMTGRKPVAPRPDWIQSVRDHIPADKIYWKENIREYLQLTPDAQQ